jgi:PPK2 family polyphosphate:nucleotide phosphotransferase
VSVRDALRATPGAPIDLGAIDTAATPGAPGDKAATRKATEPLLERLVELQERLWAEHRRSVMVVLQAMDTGGKDGAIRKVFGPASPLGVRVAYFGAPTEEELGHDPLWRIHARAPGAGEIVIFNRSHYEDVLVVRVKGFVPEERWRRRYDHFRAFEQMLHDEGTTVVKVMLHISREEQRKRLQRRLDRPDKRWKFRRGDLDDRALWPEFQAAYADAIERTGTEAAPWHVVPADRKWYRDFALASILVEVLKELDPQLPDAPEDLTGVVVPE